MKKIISLAVTLCLVLLPSCNAANKLLNAGTPTPDNSNAVNENMSVSLPPISKDSFFNKGESFNSPDPDTDYKLSYTIKEAKIFNSLSEANLQLNDLNLWEIYCDENKNMKSNYSFLALTVEVFCSQKSQDTKINPYCPSISVGKLLQDNSFQCITGEINLFFCNGSINTNRKNYFQYKIDEGENKQLTIGWFISADEAENQLIAQIGHTSLSSDGKWQDDSLYVNLGELK